MIDFIKKHKFIIILFFLSFFIRLVYILLVKTPIISDFKTMYDASIELLNHTHKYRNTPYFLFWGYQMGHVFYQYILLKLINSVLFLKIINTIITSLITVFIYLISSKYCSKIASKTISIVYMLFPFPLFLNSVLTNQHLPLLLILISIYILINMDFKNKTIFKSILIGLLLGLSNILRSEAIVILFSILIFLIIICNKIKIKNLITCFSLIIISYFIITSGTSYIFKKTNISKNGLSNQNTYWKFVCGLNHETSGVYTEEDAAIYSNNKELAKKEAINRFKKVNKLPILFIKKAKILWFNSDLSWSIGHINNNKTYKIFNAINQIFIVVFILLALFSINKLFKYDYVYLISFIILFIYTGAYMLIEVMPRYAYSLHPFIAILGAYGLDNVIRLFCNKKSLDK